MIAGIVPAQTVVEALVGVGGKGARRSGRGAGADTCYFSGIFSSFLLSNDFGGE